MAKFNRNSTYNLKRSFTDKKGNVYKGSSAAALRLHLRMGAVNSTEPVLVSPSSPSITATYDGGTPPIPSAKLGKNNYYAAVFSDTVGINGKILAPDGDLCFTTIADEAEPSKDNDLPFSISFWVCW